MSKACITTRLKLVAYRYGIASNNKSNPLFNTACGYTDEETPCSISNQEAKLVLADDTIRYSDGESRSLQALLEFHNFPYNFQFKFYSNVFSLSLLLSNKYCLINLKFYSLLGF